MSTFFEKLTSASPRVEAEAETPDFSPMLAASKTARRAPAEKEQAAVHLKVDAESVVDAAEQGGIEEEGELTVDIYDKGDEIVIQSTVAGVKPEDLDISISSDMVTIRGNRGCQDEVREDNYYYKELFWGTFARSVILPEEIDEDGAEANLKHGLLTIRLPKKKKGVVQKLKVKVS